MHRCFILTASVALCGLAQAAAPMSADPAKLTTQDIAITDVSAPNAPGKTFFAATLMNASVPRLCSVIQDYAGYHEFMPNVGKAQVLQSAPDAVLVEMTLDLPLGKVKKYRIRLEPKADGKTCHLAWKLVPTDGLLADETIADTSGYWNLLPHPADPAKTVVEYYVYADPGYVPFGFGWIVDIMSKRSLPKTLEAVRARASAVSRDPVIPAKTGTPAHE